MVDAALAGLEKGELVAALFEVGGIRAPPSAIGILPLRMVVTPHQIFDLAAWNAHIPQFVIVECLQIHDRAF